jgi:hypothetical protein
MPSRLGVRSPDLRPKHTIPHPKPALTKTDEANVWLPLPRAPGAPWDQVPSEVRNQVREVQIAGQTVSWGGREVLSELHAVFSHNMRDLATPTDGKGLGEGPFR